jgi:molybdopterin-guanine dinucleotide biosynthesis protein A
MKTVSAILLAGGRSRRMGVDKATVQIEGEPLWQRQIGILRGMPVESVRLSVNSVPAWRPVEVEVIADTSPSRGPLSGVAAGLGRLKTSHLLVLAIDLPRMTAEHLRKLWRMARPGVGVIPQNGEYFEPLCAIYPVEALALAEQMLNAGDASLQTLARKLVDCSQARIHRLREPEAALYLNMNTPADVPV